MVSSHDIHFIFDRCFHKHINYLPSEFGKLVDEIGSDIQKIKQMGVDHIIFALLPNTQDEIVKVIDLEKSFLNLLSDHNILLWAAAHGTLDIDILDATKIKEANIDAKT